jgi:hypothetical protein
MPELALGAHLQIPTFPVGLAREDGRADVLFASFGVEVSWHPLRRPVDLWAAGRGGAQWVWASGSADAGRSGRVVDAWAARIDLEVCAAVELDRVLALYGSVSGGVVVPEIAIAFGDAVVARWGLPVVEISLGLRIGLGL